MKIEQPRNDDRLKLNGVYIGCVPKENADLIMDLQAQVEWVRGVLSEYGYDGPLAEACCPLRELLKGAQS